MPRRLSRFLTDAIIIAFITAWAYVLAYLYEFGYLSQYKIPADLINIQVTSIISSILLLAFFLASIGLLGLWFFDLFLKRSYSPLGLFFIQWFIAFLIIVGIPLFVGVIFHALTAFFCYLVWFISDLVSLTRTKGNDFSEKARNLRTIQVRQNDFIDRVSKRIGFGWFLTIAIIVGISYSGYAIGYGSAARKTDYLIITINEKEFAVVAIRQNNAIALPINKETEELGKEIYIYNLEKLSESGIGMKIESIGKLKVAD